MFLVPLVVITVRWSSGHKSRRGMIHTSYLSFLLHRQDFRKPNFTPKKTTKGTKNTKNVSEKVIYMHFFHSFWKNLHLTEIFYTGTACDACDKLKVCFCVEVVSFLRKYKMAFLVWKVASRAQFSSSPATQQPWAHVMFMLPVWISA